MCLAPAGRVVRLRRARQRTSGAATVGKSENQAREEAAKIPKAKRLERETLRVAQRPADTFEVRLRPLLTMKETLGLDI